MSSVSDARTEAELFDMLARLYCEPAHVLLPHVANATGWKRQRVADALALSLWPSQGLHLTGFEMKSSRSDWLREIARPIKREAVGQFCDQWVIVAGDHGIVHQHEVPAGHGLLVAEGNELRWRVHPLETEAKPVSRELLCAIVRRAYRCSPHGRAVEERAAEIASAQVAAARQQAAQHRSVAAQLRFQLKRAGIEPVA